MYQNDQENERNNLVPHLTRFEPLKIMDIFATYLGGGGAWLRAGMVSRSKNLLGYKSKKKQKKHG